MSIGTDCGLGSCSLTKDFCLSFFPRDFSLKQGLMYLCSEDFSKGKWTESHKSIKFFSRETLNVFAREKFPFRHFELRCN